jgi:anaerobic magnesium-protoporphyrin IX monomethyl ester cyclase
MRVVLAFPPPASATYAPIGIASLAAHLRRALPGCTVRLEDLNLHAWETLAADGDEVRFLRGERGDFFDPVAYQTARRAWCELGVTLASIGEQARRYAGREVDAPEPELEALLEAQAHRLLAGDPEVVGLSLLFPEQVVFAVALARRLRAIAPSVRLLAGGAALSALDPHQLLRACPELEGLLLGEGEPGLARWLAGAALDTVPGLVSRGASCPARLARGPLDELPAPDYEGLPLGRYFNPQVVLPGLFSRGCAWRRCRFCAHNASLGRYRRKRAEAFVEELAQLQSITGAGHFYLADQYVEAAALDELCGAILERGLHLAFQVMARPTADYTEARLARAAAAGCRWISWGVESGSQRLLDLARKGTRAEVIPEVLRAARGAGISNLAMLIFGLPTSTDQDLAATLRLLEAIYPELDAVTASSFVLFDGTPFGRRPDRYRLLPLEAQVLLGRGDGVVQSYRRRHHEVADDGGDRPPRAPLELAAWEQRRRWLGELCFDQLCVEHYLLFAERRHQRLSGPAASMTGR